MFSPVVYPWICLFSQHARLINHKFAFLIFNLIGSRALSFLPPNSLFLSALFSFRKQKINHKHRTLLSTSTALSAYSSILFLTYTGFFLPFLLPSKALYDRNNEIPHTSSPHTLHSSVVVVVVAYFVVALLMRFPTARRRLVRYFFTFFFARNTFNCRQTLYRALVIEACKYFM